MGLASTAMITDSASSQGQNRVIDSSRMVRAGKGRHGARRTSLACVPPSPSLDSPSRELPQPQAAMRHLSGRTAVSLALMLLLAQEAGAQPLAFHLTFDPVVTSKPFTGRVYVMLFRAEVNGLQAGPNWFR